MLTTGCTQRFDPLEPEVAELLPPNTFIDELQEGIVTENLIVQATVTTSDEAGNFYQSLYIEEATGTLELRMSFFESFKLFHLGDVVSVRLQGLLIQRLNNQLSVNTGNLESTCRIVLRQGLHEPIMPRQVKIRDIDSTLTGRLVSIADAEFKNGGGESWSGEQRLTQDQSSITVYTSPLASYANELLPAGKVTVTGIVTLYNNKFQLKMSNP